MTGSAFRTHVLEETDTGTYTEVLYDDGETDEVLVCAAHGGAVEPGTAEQAIELAARLPRASCWACLGYDDQRSPFDLWHPPSSSFRPDEYPLLGEITNRGFETVVSLHGLSDERVLVGGAVDGGTKRRVGDRLEAALPVSVEVVAEGAYAGVSPHNFVNWLARDGTGGIQLEQAPSVRAADRETVVDVLEELITAGAL